MQLSSKLLFRTAIIMLGVLLMVTLLVAANAQKARALNPTQWEIVRGYIDSYYGGSQYNAADRDGEGGFRMGKVDLWNRLDSNGDIAPNAGAAVGSTGIDVTGVLGEGDDAVNRPVLIDNLRTQTGIIPGTEFRCNWNTNEDCFSNASITAIRDIVDNHQAAGFSTDIVDYCVSSHTAGPSTGGFGIIAQVPGALSSDTLLIPRVYNVDYSRNGWRNSLVTFDGAEAVAAPEASAGGFAAPGTVANCDASAPDIELVRCQANWAIDVAGGNVGNGQTDLGIIGAADQSVDVRNGASINTLSTAGTNLQLPLGTLFSTSSLANLDPTKTTVLASRTQMGATAAIGLRMLGYTMIPNAFISYGISRWSGAEGEDQVAYSDGLPLQSIASYGAPAKVDTTGPSVSSVAAENVGTGSADIHRVAAEPATMKVEYGTAPGVYTTTVNNTVLNADKTVSLSSLVAGTTYYYQVTSYDGQANGTVSPESSFTTDSINDRYYYLPWYDSTTSTGMRAWICIANLTDHTISNVEVRIGTSTKGTMDIPAGGHVELKYDDVIGGPARVRIPAGITSGDKLTISERTLYLDSFNENLAVDKADAGSSYAFTWYDNQPAWGMRGNWIGIINVDTTDATVDVYINDMGTPAITRVVAPGAVDIFQMPTVITNGPVKVTAQGSKKIITSQRVLYLNSFNEIMGDKLL